LTLELKMKLSERRNRFRRKPGDFYRLKNVDSAYGMADTIETSTEKLFRAFWKSVFFLERILLVCGYTLLFYAMEVGCESMLGHVLSQCRFSVQRIDIQNTVLLKEEDVLSSIQIKTETNILTTDLDEIRQKIEKLPNIKEAVVKRILPGRLSIHLYERVPALRLLLTEDLLDEDGKEVQLKNGYQIFHHLPILGGFTLSPLREIPFEKMKRYKEVVQLIKSFSRKFTPIKLSVKKVMSSEDWVDFFLPNGTRVRFPAENAEEKFEKFSIVWRDLSEKKNTARSIDLQFKDVVVTL
jgi:cell division septal protein FtsQ